MGEKLCVDTLLKGAKRNDEYVLLEWARLKKKVQ